MQGKTTYFYPHKTLRLGEQLFDLSTPKLMGILNITPDSFFDGGNFIHVKDALDHTGKMVKEGADIIDIGGMSSKPGAEIISADEELKRIMPVITAVLKEFTVPVSVDTVWGKVATEAINAGATLINDISAGTFDPSIQDICIAHNTAYVLMHMQGTPATMQQQPEYENVVGEVFQFMLDNCRMLHNKGMQQIIIDPGFGFGKNLEQNYALAKQLSVFKNIGMPLMTGISRKSMICKLLKVNPDKALNGSTALHAALLLKGSDILRVHDVAEAKQVIDIVQNLK